MTEIIQTFFDLTVGFPLAVIGLLGLILCIVAASASSFSLFARKRFPKAILLDVLVVLLLLGAFGVLPMGPALGAPLAMITAATVFVTHSRLAREEGERWSLDPILSGAGAIALIAIGIPMLMLAFGRLAG